MVFLSAQDVCYSCAPVCRMWYHTVCDSHVLWKRYCVPPLFPPSHYHARPVDSKTAPQTSANAATSQATATSNSTAGEELQMASLSAPPPPVPSFRWYAYTLSRYSVLALPTRQVQEQGMEQSGGWGGPLAKAKTGSASLNLSHTEHWGNTFVFVPPINSTERMQLSHAASRAVCSAPGERVMVVRVWPTAPKVGLDTFCHRFGAIYFAILLCPALSFLSCPVLRCDVLNIAHALLFLDLCVVCSFMRSYTPQLAYTATSDPSEPLPVPFAPEHGSFRRLYVYPRHSAVTAMPDVITFALNML
jgi:hypothetical protein